MASKSSRDWNGCPIRYGAAIFGDTWCLVILRDLILKGARHYADFLGAGEGIATNVLASRLAGLEEEGVLRSRPDPEHGARKIYELTDKGLGLVPVLLEVVDWSETWDPNTEVPREFAKELRADRQKLARKIVRRLKRARGA